MALQTILSKKDKITIAVLLFAGAVFMVAWFLIRPTITSIIDTNEKIEQAKITQTQYKNKIMYLTSSEAIYGKTVDDLNASTCDYYEIMDSSEIDKLVTSYVLKSGLFAEDLSISMPAGSVVESPYIYSDLAGSKSSSVTTASANANKDADTLLAPYNTARNNATSTRFSGVQSVGVTVVVTGTPKVCQDFIDDICTKPAVRITGFEWSTVDPIEVYNEETGNYEKVDSGKVRLRFSCNLYMAEIADYDVAVSE